VGQGKRAAPARREQAWDGSTVRFCSTLRYVGLPGQHYFDVLSMGAICVPKKLRLDYLGFRTGGGPDAPAVRLAELTILSNSRYFTANSVTYPDNIENIGKPNTVAARNFDQRGPFDIINLDVCGGILHGNTTPLLSAIKHVLTSQALRQQPWLLFVTTTAKASEIAADVITRFFSTVTSNCESVAMFKAELASAAERCGLPLDISLSHPAALEQSAFLRFFTLAFGKWLLGNLGFNRPPAALSLHSVYCFRNTGRVDPEVLSLAYLISPVIGGGKDPSGLTAQAAARQRYENMDSAIELVASSIDRIQDLDEIWDKDPALKTKIVAECERLLRLIGVDDESLMEWRRHNHLT